MSEKQNNDDTQESRRGVVKGIALGVGGVSVTQWTKPVIETVVLPAHAQTTAGRVVVTAAVQGGVQSPSNP